jgi:hypothetical protein
MEAEPNNTLYHISSRNHKLRRIHHGQVVRDVVGNRKMRTHTLLKTQPLTLLTFLKESMSYISYHTRRDGTDEKITAGATHSITALLADYIVIFQPSGRPVFMDDKGRKVNVYTRLNPEDHSEYPAALAAYRRDQQIAAQLAKDRKEQITCLLSGMTDEEILKRLTR